jgi:hypothetical protein
LNAEIGYLAGMIDADGTIGIYRRQRYYVPSIKVFNTRRTIIDRCCEILDSYGCSYCVVTRVRGGRRQVSWTVVIEGQIRAKKLLDLLYPHLAGKKEQAEAILALCDLAHSSERQEAMKALCARTMALNQKGRITD